ncbi:hypothetical protein [Mycobacteroides salmoniphilum]|uniref:hypothetical protein n=1 Tax=Mycobacteroides salmoniphilum TaxID=404941 RepID=UPI000993535B|nr:hypothetical protein [Mycobacteroides salmoniphilum]
MNTRAQGVEQLGDCLLVRPDAIPVALFAWGRAIDVAKATPQMRKHVARLEAQRRVAQSAFESRMSDSGHGDVADRADLRESIAGQRNWVDTADAATRTGLGRRQLQRIARSLSLSGDAHRVGNSWAINPDALSDYIINRELRQEI